MNSSLTTTHSEAAVDLPPFLDGFSAIHRAMRRDAQRLVRVSATVDDRYRARRLARWYDHFVRSIEHHHRREDDVVWPVLVGRQPEFAAQAATLEHDHVVLDAALGAVASALLEIVDGNAGDAHALVAAAERLRHHLGDHLDREEAAVFPLIIRSFTHEEFHDLEARLREGSSIAALAFEAPWLLDDLPGEQAARLIADAPFALRVLHHLAFRPRYRRITAVFQEMTR